MSYYYSQQYSTWFYYPYPYSVPYSPLHNHSYAMALSLHKSFRLPPLPTLNAPSISMPPLHPLVPDMAAIADLVQKGFQSVAAPHSSQRAVHLPPVACPSTVALPMVSMPVADLPSHISHSPAHHTPLDYLVPHTSSVLPLPLSPLPQPAPHTAPAPPAPTTMPRSLTVLMALAHGSHQHDLSLANLML